MARKKAVVSDKAIGYLRVSTVEQALSGVSIAAQEAILRRYADTQGLVIDEFIVDAGVSGGLRLDQRPGGARLLARTRGGQAGIVIAAKLDRLFRDALDALSVTREWDAGDVALHLVEQQINTRSALGKDFVAMLAAVAELERNLIGERTAAALGHLKSQGVVLGGAALGWRRTGDVDASGRRVIVCNEHEALAVARIYALQDEGLPAAAIAATMSLEGWQTKRRGRWWPSTVAKILRRRVRDECAHSRAA